MAQIGKKVNYKILQMRASGLSFREMGEELGITRQAAELQYKREYLKFLLEKNDEFVNQSDKGGDK